MKEKVTAIVLAAGQGKRMNTSVAKQFLELKGKPILYYSLKAFEDSRVDQIILVTGKDQMEYCKQDIVKKYGFTKVSHIVEGGKERYDSVYKALESIDSTDYVLIHDGARPFLSDHLIELLLHKVKEYKACLIGIPVKETIKMIDTENNIIATPNRNTLWAAQTPQAFEFSSIWDAYQQFYCSENMDALGITDDAMLYEVFIKNPVKMLRGDYNNIKLTTPEDMILAEIILDKMQ